MNSHAARFVMLIGLVAILAACTSTRKKATLGDFGEPIQGEPATRSLQSQLGMSRPVSELGFTQKPFNPCNYGLNDRGCGSQYFSVIHFQLLCRDSEGTISVVPQLEPITAPSLQWQIGNQNGGTRTDHNGFGQFTVISPTPITEKRLVLRKGKQFLGVTAGEVTRLVLPKDWCSPKT